MAEEPPAEQRHPS